MSKQCREREIERASENERTQTKETKHVKVSGVPQKAKIDKIFYFRVNNSFLLHAQIEKYTGVGRLESFYAFLTIKLKNFWDFGWLVSQ